MKSDSTFFFFQNICQELLEAAERSSSPAVAVPENGFVVFLSLCDGAHRASVVHGRGSSLEEAFAQAQRFALDRINQPSDRNKSNEPFRQQNKCSANRPKAQHSSAPFLRWIKADVVTEYAPADAKTLAYMIREPGWNEFFRYGLSFDRNFSTALLEEELNAVRVLDYSSGSVSLPDLNRYLKKSGRPELPTLPGFFLLFNTAGFFIDLSEPRMQKDSPLFSPSSCSRVIPLIPDGLCRGRRKVPSLDASFARALVTSAASFLERQVQPDGSFCYGYYPRFDRVIPGYNCMRHASTIWSLLVQYRLTKKSNVLSLAARSIDYLLTRAVVFRDPETAYLSEPSKREIKLGGGGVLILAIAEYLDLCSEDPHAKAMRHDNIHPERDAASLRYVETARALGEGILSLMDPESGEFFHVLNMDFSRKERYRTVYYDGEAAYALCRLYRLTHEKKWLLAAEKAVNHFLAADYTRFRDHWVAYAMNEITRYIRRDDYDTFALRNARVNLDFLYKRKTTYHTFLELLMVTFETFERIRSDNPDLPYLKEFDLPYFLRTIRVRADRMLNGFFFPEYAMYMRRPDSILGSFMVRHDGFRVRIDDVQHNIGGFYLYYKNYSRLVALGMPVHAAPPALLR